MKALSCLVLSVVTAAGAVTAISTQAQATLQFSVGFAGSEASFTCVDNSACDSDPAIGIISIPDISFEGITADHVITTASADSLDFTVGSLTNDSGATLMANFAVSDTGFSDPTRFQTRFSATWRNAVQRSSLRVAGNAPESSVDVGWFDDPANAQGANNPTDAPGSLFDSFSTDTLTGFGTASYTNTGALVLSPPFSLTVQGNIQLQNGETVSASESETVAVPEPSTWTMLIAGFAGLGIAGYRVSRTRSALAI